MDMKQKIETAAENYLNQDSPSLSSNWKFFKANPSMEDHCRAAFVAGIGWYASFMLEIIAETK